MWSLDNRTSLCLFSNNTRQQTINNITNLDKFKKATYLTDRNSKTRSKGNNSKKNNCNLSYDLLRKKILNYSSLKTLWHLKSNLTECSLDIPLQNGWFFLWLSEIQDDPPVLFFLKTQELIEHKLCLNNEMS
jgi:hypothetical protein